MALKLLAAEDWHLHDLDGTRILVEVEILRLKIKFSHQQERIVKKLIELIELIDGRVMLNFDTQSNLVTAQFSSLPNSMTTLPLPKHT